MAAAKRCVFQKTAVSRRETKLWCAEKAVASFSNPRTNGQTSFAPVWALGRLIFLVLTNHGSEISEIRWLDARFHARHGLCELRSSRRGAGRHTSAGLQALRDLHQFDHLSGIALWRRSQAVEKTAWHHRHLHGRHYRNGFRSIRRESVR